MTPEQKRRLDALESATNHIECCELDYEECGADTSVIHEPFSVSPWTNVSGEVNVIYDRSGNVERIVRHDCDPIPGTNAYDWKKFLIDTEVEVF